MYLSPFEPYFDDGVWDFPFNGSRFNAETLEQIRSDCRQLALHNEFAINAIENRVNYVVGNGHRHRTVAKKPVDEPLADTVQELLGEFMECNDWAARQQEMMRRLDRDGEVFVRMFPCKRGLLQIRFIEPEQIFTPSRLLNEPSMSHGISTDRNDVENVLGYFVEGQFTDASEILHRKSNVDSTVKRGLPLLFPVRKNLRRAEKLLRNMSVVAEIQSAVALIRKHQTGSAQRIQDFVQHQKDGLVTDDTGQSKPFQHFAPGTIIDAARGIDYEFPISAIDAGKYIAVLQAELRAVASRLVMPEFMLSSDASNANYSSTMIAEGPAVRMFERLQQSVIEQDSLIFRKALDVAMYRGLIPFDTLQRVAVHCIPPILAVRNRLDEARADEILYKNGILSKETFAMRYGLDPSKEERLCLCDPSNSADKRQG